MKHDLKCFKKLTKKACFGIVSPMRKITILLVLLCFCSNTYAFWVWSPKTKKWKNPKDAPLATPSLQFKEAFKLFEEENYKEAQKSFKTLLSHYPDSKEAAEAQYYLGRCLEIMDRPYQAFLEYQKVIESYPNSQRVDEIVKREYEIGESFLNREPKKWLGVSWYDFVEHPSMEIFKKIVDKVPYSEYAPRAQYKLGLLYSQLGRYDDAREIFQKVIDSYPDSEWAMPAKYQLAIAASKAFPGAAYDGSSLRDASRQLDDFIKKHPDAQISATAKSQLIELKDKEAKKEFEVGLFYEKQRQYKAAQSYYQIVVQKYPDSGYAQQAKEKIKQLEEKINAKK